MFNFSPKLTFAQVQKVIGRHKRLRKVPVRAGQLDIPRVDLKPKPKQ